MAFIARVFNRKRFTDQDIHDLIRRAGYTLIELSWNGKGTSHKTLGIENLMISLPQGRREPLIEIIKDGHIKWSVDKWNQVTAWIHKSEKNMHFLAMHYSFEKWTIIDKNIRAEVQKMSDAHWASMTPDEVKYLERQISDGSRNWQDPGPAPPKPEGIRKEILEEDNEAMRKKIAVMEHEKQAMEDRLRNNDQAIKEENDQIAKAVKEAEKKEDENPADKEPPPETKREPDAQDKKAEDIEAQRKFLDEKRGSEGVDEKLIQELAKKPLTELMKMAKEEGIEVKTRTGKVALVTKLVEAGTKAAVAIG